MVGQRFALLLANHPWFHVTALAASPRSAGKTYAEAVNGRWNMTQPIPENLADMILLDASDIKTVASLVDFVFCAVDMKSADITALEEAYAKAEIPVISNNKEHRFTPDVPMIIPEINADHLSVVPFQRKRLGTKKGFITAKCNCSIVSFVPAVAALMGFGVERVLACTYQAISGASKTFDTMPEIIDNVIPYIGGEEAKTEKEPLKILGNVDGGVIVPAQSPAFTAQCIRVPVSDGHLAAAFIKFKDGNKPTKERIIDCWRNYGNDIKKLGLPSAPEHFLTYFEEDNFPQTKLHRDLYGGMGISLGRLREDSQYDYKFIGLSHNTLRGAAGGGVFLAELCAAKGLFD
jgi:aspartate-semialdehyde dehydrogenase